MAKLTKYVIHLFVPGCQITINCFTREQKIKMSVLFNFPKASLAISFRQLSGIKIFVFE